MFKFIRELIIDNLGSITGDAGVDFIIAFILSSLIGAITYSKVGDLYDAGFISGSLPGKILYTVIFLFIYIAVFYVLLGAASVLRIIGLIA